MQSAPYGLGVGQTQYITSQFAWKVNDKYKWGGAYCCKHCDKFLPDSTSRKHMHLAMDCDAFKHSDVAVIQQLAVHLSAILSKRDR
eukprot:1898460-Rhodomonas_salina.1